MKQLEINLTKVYDLVPQSEITALRPACQKAMDLLNNGKGKGSDFLGWLHLPSLTDEKLLSDIQKTADLLREKCEVVVVAGIGGSYLGAKAVIDALNNSFDWLKTKRENPVVVYAGHNISEDYLFELSRFLEDKRFGIINISKSGTTTETALAFRLLKTKLEKQVGKEAAREHIVAITDASKGALRQLAQQEGYKTFVIPDSVGGRYSVLTPVGLLPIAVAGHNIRELLAGALAMEKRSETAFEQNPAALYAAARQALYNKGKKIEILANYHPKLHFVAEWWKQLYGESEGKEHKGLFPAAVDLTTDLHSMGQWIQEGERTIFETVISIVSPNREVVIPTDTGNLDGLNYLAGKRVDQVNKMAELGTQIAHVDGGVPNIKIELPELNEYHLGELLYFFEKACGISGYMMGINPFDQPGVEAYKKNMFALLQKPGYEAESAAIRSRL
ncbi:MAG TPA: glucose-6-phosphate isomerase [Bacteroidales bacterium]|nr:glucose-6-phosphate isomerase [Bacteroidales bacterium]HOQ58434.1 glucose-6-phosphate isomerase [Bacteroidales bacterium]